jgi:heme-degrading monooxygenase HmoA
VAKFEPEQIVTVFRSRLDPAHQDEYAELAPRMMEMAAAMPGFVDAKTFRADDGERVTVVTFAGIESHRAWRDQPDHQRAQASGRARLYVSYSTQVCVALSVSEKAPREKELAPGEH